MTPLAHSPADIVSRAIIANGGGSDPGPPDADWPVNVSKEADMPDNALTVYNTTGMDDGRSNPDAERMQHYGIQVRVRATSHPAASAKAYAIAILLDEVYTQTIDIGSSSYLLHSVNRVGPPVDVGKETPTSKRSIYTINALAALRIIS